MASFSTNTYAEGRYYTFTYSYSQDTAKNTSTMNWTLSCTGGVSWYAERTLILNIDGDKVVNKSDRVVRYAGNIASGTKTLPRFKRNKSISVSIQAAVPRLLILFRVENNCLDQIKRISGSITGSTIGEKVT